MLQLKYLSVALIAMSGLVVSSSQAVTLKAMTDEQLADTTGQALMSLSYIAPNDSANLMSKYSSGSNIGFYKLGLEADIALNANIANLQLGCGGSNNAVSNSNSCDIDIKNLSLSGLNDGSVASGTTAGSPTFSSSRASTDATISNPFIQFAIKNPNSASTREVVGLQLGAASIIGLLTTGMTNSTTASTTDGIQRLSGFMQIAATTGTATTKQTTFGKADILNGYANISNLTDVSFTSDPSKSVGITIPSMGVTFSVPSFTVNGVRQTSANVQNITTTISSIPLDSVSTDSLYVNLGCNAPSSGLTCGLLTGLVSNTTFKMATGSNITNLNMNITFQEALSMIHNIQLTGTGAYLSLQNTAMLWPGATVASSDTSNTSLSSMSSGTDVAQKGWWMSFAQPVQLGKLNVTNQVDISSVLPQVATLTSAALQVKPYTYVDFGSALNALVGQPIVQKINVDLGSATSLNPVTMTLKDQQLTNQTVVSNCYGSLKFC